MKAPALIGRTIAGRFTITGFLREGAMAAIYRATQEADPREVAVKVMLPQLLADPTFVGRFRREAKAAARLKHPNTVRIIDYGVDGRLPYIAMELLVGQDLYEVLTAHRRLPEARAAKILMQVCDALSAAHAQGIVHRDLKPENIMLLVDPIDPQVEHVRVLDFGIAKVLERELGSDEAPSSSSFGQSVLTMAGVAVGTPAYMAPEQCRGDDIDARTDVYACGILLYHLVTGRLPFTGETPVDVATKHLRDPPPPPTTIVPTLNKALEATILTALSKQRDLRQPTAEAFKGELERALPHLNAAATIGAAIHGGLPRLDSDALKTLPRGDSVDSSPQPTPRLFRRAASPVESAATQPSMNAVRIPGAAHTAPAETAEITARSVAQGAPSQPRPRIGGDTLRALPRPTGAATLAGQGPPSSPINGNAPSSGGHAPPSSEPSSDATARAVATAAAPAAHPGPEERFDPDNPPFSGRVLVAPDQAAGHGQHASQAPVSGPQVVVAGAPTTTPARGTLLQDPSTPPIHESEGGAYVPSPSLGAMSPLAQSTGDFMPVEAQATTGQHAARQLPFVPASATPAPMQRSGVGWVAWLLVPFAIAVGVVLGFAAFEFIR